MTDQTTQKTNGAQAPEELSRLVIRFAGDSGDGIQLTGARFSATSAVMGNDLATFPDFPAEIRAPAGTVHGVSAFQVQISDHDITTPGEEPTVLVAMNPAALMSELHRVKKKGTIIVNVDTFDDRNFAKAGFKQNPLEDSTLDDYTVFQVPMTSLTKEVCKDLGVKPRDADRSKNFFALGLISWLYHRTMDPTLEWIEKQFANNELVKNANAAAFKAGHAFGETAEMFDARYDVPAAALPAGTYTSITGSIALSWGLLAASEKSDLPIFLGSYPITPASDILHELSTKKNFGVKTLQAEDEIAAVCAAMGASYGGHIGVTTTSGPGVALKGETIGLAISLELPLVVIDVQRGGPSTGLPTKTEATDLLMAYFGRHGESPLPILAPYSPTNCFPMAFEAVRIALKYRTPIILLSDAYLANGSEPWLLPNMDDFPDISTNFATDFNHETEEGKKEFWPYIRDPETLARDWALPGTLGLMHRIGGIEKEDGTGNISYDPFNHEKMTHIRADKIQGIANDIPDTWINTAAGDIGGIGSVSNAADISVSKVTKEEHYNSDHPKLLLVGWGSTWGAISSAVRKVRREGIAVDYAHLTHLCPFPADFGDILKRYDQILVPEMNMGQLAFLIRGKYLANVRSISKVQAQPYVASELKAIIIQAANGELPDEDVINVNPNLPNRFF